MRGSFRWAETLAVVALLALVVTLVVALGPSSPVGADSRLGAAVASPPDSDQDGGQAPDPVAGSPDPEDSAPAEVPDPPKSDPIPPDVLKAVADTETHPEGVPVFAIASPEAAADIAFQEVFGALSPLGRGMYHTVLTGDDVETLGDLEGYRLVLEKEVSLDPPAEDLESPYSFSSTENRTVPSLDPALSSVRKNNGNLQGQGQVIAVIDSGINTSAAGLSSKVTKCVDFVKAPDNVMYEDDEENLYFGFEVYPSHYSCASGSKRDPNGHGTHVASIAAGASNTKAKSVMGVAPSAKLIDLRVLGKSGGGSGWDIYEAMWWVLINHDAYGIDVVNMSLGFDESESEVDPVFDVLVNWLVADGVFVSVAAGNAGDASSTIYSPGTAVFGTTVGAATVTSEGSSLANYSSQGPLPTGDGIDLLAPGTNILAARSPASGKGTTIAMSGTSMATPYVAGLAALLLQQDPDRVPGGAWCYYDEDTCPHGVHTATMTNGAEDAMQTSDWFDAGSDELSGRGLVSASKSLLGEAVPAASSVELTFQPDSPTLIEVPPHSSPVTLTIVTDMPLIDHPSYSRTTEFTWIDDTGGTSMAKALCTPRRYEWTGTCESGLFGGYVRVSTFVSPASATPMWLQVRVPDDMEARVVAPGLDESLIVSSGVLVGDVVLDENGDATVEVTLTYDTSGETVFAIDPALGLEVPESVTIPAGSAGTSATFDVSLADGYTPPAAGGSTRVVLRGGGSIIGMARVAFPASESPAGLITADGNAIDMGELYAGSSVVSVSDTGVVVGASAQPGIGRDTESGLEVGPYAVAPDSTDAQPLEIVQSTVSAIDVYGVSSDGSTAVLGQAPTGGGIFAGDHDLRLITFAHDIATGENTEIGTSITLPRAGEVHLNLDGSRVAYVANGSLADPFYDNLRRIYVQDLDPSTPPVLLASGLSPTNKPRIIGVTDTQVLVEIVSGSKNYLRKYSLASPGSYSSVSLGGLHGSITMNGDGTAVAYRMTGTSDKLTCLRLSDNKKYTISWKSHRPVSDTVRAGSNCSYVVAALSSSTSSKPPSTGAQLVRITTKNARTTLAVNSGRRIDAEWVTGPSGQQVVTISPYQYEAGDVNGMVDLYRGAWGSPTAQNLAVPTVSGTTIVGSTLSTTQGEWQPIPDKYTYQWRRNGAAISKATKSTYTLTSSDRGKAITVTVTVHRSGHAPTSVTTAPTSAILGKFSQGKSAISGTVGVENTVKASVGTWSPKPSSYTYQWRRDGVPIDGATGSSYTLVPDDAGTQLTLAVTAHKSGYASSTKVTPAKAVPLYYSATPELTVDGAGTIGSTLTAVPGDWEPGPVSISYQWKRNGASISKATKSTYKLTSSDLNKNITVTIKVSKSGYGTVYRTSAPVKGLYALTSTPTPTIDSPEELALLGHELTAVPGTWGPGTVALAYQWLRDGEPIEGATSITYTVVGADADSEISVRVTGSRSSYKSVAVTSDPITSPPV